MRTNINFEPIPFEPITFEPITVPPIDTDAIILGLRALIRSELEELLREERKP
jgi:hypothetical protein